MKSLLLSEYNHLEIADFPVPPAGPGEVLVRVEACGICGSDVHGYDGSSGRRIPPIVMGHEAAGTVAAVGAGVKGYAEGDRVTFDSTVYCGECAYCQRGEINLCDNRAGDRRFLRRLPASRRVCRVCRGAAAHPVSAAGDILLRRGGDAGGSVGGAACGAGIASRGRRNGAGDRRGHDRPAHNAGRAGRGMRARVHRGRGRDAA